VVQSAYRTLRASLLEAEGSSSAAAALEDDDVEWAEHDWKWKARYGDVNDPNVARKHTRARRRRAARPHEVGGADAPTKAR